MLLFISIGIAWLAVITLFVAICHTAAEGENGRALADLGSVSIGPKLVLSAAAERPRRPRRRAGGHRPSADSRQLTSRRLRSAHGTR
jgi:hypothetical protein